MKTCKNCDGIEIAQRPMPHLGFGDEPIWVHVERYTTRSSKIAVETYYRTCMSTTVAEPSE